MFIDCKKINMSAIREAGRIRNLLNISPLEPIAAIDVATKLGIEVRIVNIPSLEGLYISNEQKPKIMLSSCRPFGRQSFTCAHELGHYIFGHGTKVDEYMDNSESKKTIDPEEYMANGFASHLLMPKRAIIYSFKKRKWDLSNVNPEQMFIIAGELGVSYRGLIQHTGRNLQLIGLNSVEQLIKISPKKIKSNLISESLTSEGNLLVIDESWDTNKAGDICVGDFLLLPDGISLENKHLEIIDASPKRILTRGLTKGICKVSKKGSDWAVYIRITDKNYVGRSIFRFVES